jgi:hypothetical protein
VKPFIWQDSGVWFVSPRGPHGVLYWKPYPGTKDAGYPTLIEAMDAAHATLTLSPS